MIELPLLGARTAHQGLPLSCIEELATDESLEVAFAIVAPLRENNAPCVEWVPEERSKGLQRKRLAASRPKSNGCDPFPGVLFSSAFGHELERELN
jgi:hypothetical protein